MKKLTHSFTTVPNHLIDDERLDCFEFRILCYLCKLADENNMCYPSFKTISKATGISESKVKKSVKHLLELKYLSYTQRLKSDGSLSSNMYLIHLDSQPENNHSHSACTGGSVLEELGGVCDSYNQYLNNNNQTKNGLLDKEYISRENYENDIQTGEYHFSFCQLTSEDIHKDSS